MRAAMLSLTLAAVAALCPLTAYAGSTDPKERIVPADRARAKAMVLRASDLPGGFKVSRSSGGGSDGEAGASCPALDESGLTLTGKAESPQYTRGGVAVFSSAQIYASQGEADTSWANATSAAGLKCANAIMRKVLRADGLAFAGFRRSRFPDVAERSISLRGAATYRGVKVYIELLALARSRAQVTLMFISGGSPVPQSRRLDLAWSVASRMAGQMREAPAVTVAPPAA